LGIARGAFEQAIKHSKQREQFGRKIIQFQGLQFMLVDLYTQIEAARSLVYRAAHSCDVKSPEAGRLGSMARMFATEVAVKTTLDSIQIHGGYGYMTEGQVEHFYRDAKALDLFMESGSIERSLLGDQIAGKP
jgi:alkylation response protein AidB-like acyl-CoA dehydrogenase